MQLGRDHASARLAIMNSGHGGFYIAARAAAASWHFASVLLFHQAPSMHPLISAPLAPTERAEHALWTKTVVSPAGAMSQNAC